MNATMQRRQTRWQAIREAQEKLKLEPVYIDTETTGLKGRDQVVEIAIVNHDGETLFESLVKPTMMIPPDAAAIHGIRDLMVADAPPWVDVWPLVEKAIAGREVAIYNADFDMRLMQQSHQQHGMGWRWVAQDPFCVMRLYARFFAQWNASRGDYRWHSLDNAGRQSGIDLPNSHRARDDALLTRALLVHMAQSQP